MSGHENHTRPRLDRSSRMSNRMPEPHDPDASPCWFIPMPTRSPSQGGVHVGRAQRSCVVTTMDPEGGPRRSTTCSALALRLPRALPLAMERAFFTKACHPPDRWAARPYAQWRHYLSSAEGNPTPAGGTAREAQEHLGPSASLLPSGPSNTGVKLRSSEVCHASSLQLLFDGAGVFTIQRAASHAAIPCRADKHLR
jgi:hypothetical protein